MAQFKLGRIRFVWKGTWSGSYVYIVDDVVQYNGKTYICVVSHTSGTFSTDLANATPRWNLMTDGVSWSGDWATSTTYEPGTIVKYGGLVYICKTKHTSAATVSLGLETNAAAWDTFATSFAWKGTWSATTRYKFNDIVKYGGYIFVCNTQHTSQSLLESDQGKWDTFNAGLEYKTTWTASTYYKTNDIVKYGADLWICTTAHTSTSTFDTSNFTIFVNGFQFESSWSNATAYQIGDIVTYGGNAYVTLQNHTGQTPSTATSYWSVFTTGFNYRGDWSNSTAYKVGDVTRLGGYTYLAILDGTGQTPPNATYWSQLNSGLKWRTTSGSYSAVSASVVTGSGSGSPTFNVSRNNAVYTVTVASGGTNFAVSNTLKILGTAVGGASPVNDIAVTVATLSGSAIATVTAVGIAVTWTVTTAYVLGDVVLYGANSYVCINPHTATTGNRPDADTTGTYWNLLTAGAESAQLIATGDTFYYSSSGPSRLPIGLDGQVLRVSNGLPSWGYFGAVNNLVYVSPSGQDRADYGITPETPLKTIRYACKLVEDGYLNQNASSLLARNKQFLIKEVNNYINYTYTYNVGTTTISSDGARPNQLTLATLATTTATADGVTGTVGFATQSVAPYAVGDTIVIAGVTPGAFNSTFTVTACTTTSVSFALAQTAGPQTVAGTISRSTANLFVGLPVTFTASANGIVAGTQYYVKTIPDSRNFTVSATPSGNAITITASGSVTTSACYTYDATKTERDAGISLEAAIYDLSHGGTLNTTTAALAYYASASTYISGVYSYDIVPFVLALNYLSTLTTNILANTAPTNNYQALKAQATTAIQILDTINTAESGSSATVTGLVSIVTTGLSAGSTSAIPTAIQPNTTISVKTGTYTEVLPIVVPRNTAIVGDELRSTVVQPKPAIALLANDKVHTITALTRTQSLLSDLISNTTITPTSGNTQTQVTTLPVGSAGTATAATVVTNSADLMIDVIKNGLSSVPAFTFTNPTGYNTSYLIGYGDGKAQVVQNYTFTKDDIGAYFALNYSSLWTALGGTAQTQFKTDVSYILDALQHDMTYGGNVQTLIAGSSYYSNYVYVGTAQKAATIDAYGRLKTLISQIVLKTGVVATSGNGTSWVTTGTAGSAGAATFAQARIQDIIDWITNGYAPTSLLPTASIALASSALQASYTQLLSRRTEIQSDTTAWVKKNYQSMTFIEATCYRDAGLIVDALAYDLALGTNINSITVGRSYLRATTSAQYVIANQLAAELGSINFIMYKARQIAAAGAVAEATNLINNAVIGIRGTVTTTTASVATSGTLVTVASTAGMSAGMKFVAGTTIGNIVANTWYWILTVPSATTLTISATYGGSTFDPGTATATVSVTVGELPETHGSITYNNTLGTIKGAEIIRANKNFLAYEATAYITASYGGTVTTTTASTDLFTLGSAHNFVAGDPVIFSGTIYTGSGVVIGTTYYVLASGLTSTAFKVSATSGGTAIDVTTNNSSGTTLIVRYSFDAVSCRRDTLAFLDAFIYDLQYTGNYKTRRATILYNNAVSGSLTSDMYYVRNGSGLRNMTLSGLTGALSSANAYGTKRPTAGAYSSLDPGFGPNDTNVWINSRSCYTQNLTLFGFGCSGMKIDAALHNGGNKSIVANDYTTIISDGLGVWCTGSGALTELISVFAYYSYAGYLSELGGRIRAANGNSSYGTYGVIAEGTDTFETPINSTVNNRYYEATVTSTVTDGLNQILRLEYGNAGTAYTNSSYAISGAGYNATAIGDEFRDSAVFETRLIDSNDGSATSVGGTSYVTISNAAQASTTVGQIKIANTDTALASAYAGMRVQITAGSGVGQYANILSYDNASKIALITKDSFVPLTVTATAVTNGLLTVASTASLYVNMPIYLSGTMTGTGGATGLTANTLYYVIAANFSATQFAVSTTSGGSAVTISNIVTALTITLNAAGWDHVIAGYTGVTNSLDLTTTYIIEPRISYTSPGYTGIARTLSATATWTSAAYGAGKFVAVASGSTSASQSTDGKTWSTAGALSASTTWADVTYVGGEGATVTAVVGGLGGSGAVLTAVLGVSNGAGLPQADQVASVTIVSGGVGYTTPPTIVFSGGSGSNATATCVVRNGAIVSVTVVTNGSSYVSAPTCTAATDRVTSVVINTAGRNYNTGTVPTVTFTGGGASVQATATATVSNQGLASIVLGTAGTGYTSVPNVTILDANAKFIAIASTANNSATQTIAGLVGPSAWSAGTSTGKTDLAAIAYGNGVAVAVGGTSATGSVVSTSDFGSNWSDRSTTVNTANALSAGAYTSVAYGNGVFVAVNGGGGAKSSVSTNGTTTWTAGGTIPFTTSVSVAYGDGRFVILGSDGKVCYSYDLGVTWTQSATCAGATTSILSSSYTWTRIKYGQGLFVAISQGTVGATSEDGINWVVRTLPTSTNWKGLAFGNPSSVPTWVAVSNSSSTSAVSMLTGPRPLGRVKVTAGVVSEVRIVEPGSGFLKGSIAVIAASNVINTSDTSNMIDSQPVEFTGLDANGLTTNTTYYVIGAQIVSNTSFKVSATAGSATAVTITAGTGLSGTFRTGPIVTQTDPNRVKTAALRVRLGDGALGNPSFSNRGTGNTTASTAVAGDGYSDLFQNSAYINVAGLFASPTPGSNIQFGTITGTWYKLVSVTNVLGTAGNYTATFQINPALTTKNAPIHGDSVVTRLKYSQVRLTGHDFLYIGTGNQATTNYPYVDPTLAIQANQTAAFGGGRVFFTSTDQDGNFNVGNLFGVQQATGTATLNASAFNLAGLQSLQLGAVTLGVGSAIINQFSTDPYFTANSDNILPTQKAVKAYITSQIGGGSSTLNVNTLTSGVITISGNTITTSSGVQINITSKMNFTGGIDGSPVALALFTQK